VREASPRIALHRPVKEIDKLVENSRPVRLRRDVGGNQPLGLDAERRIDAEAGLARPIGLPATCQLQSIPKPLSVDANAVP
jgi:hypothetical protein